MEFNGVVRHPDQETPGAIHCHFVKWEGVRNFSSCAVMGATAGPPERGSQADFVPRVFVLLLRRAEEGAHSSDPGSSGSRWTRPSTYPCSISEIHAIQSLVSSGVHAEPWPYLECGQRVQIADHALQGLEGILVGHKGNHRIIVSVTLLRRSVALEIHRSCVIPIQPPCDVLAGSVSEGARHEVSA